MATTREEFAGKADWEGGLAEYFLSYGVHLDDFSKDDDEVFYNAVAAVKAAEPAFASAIDALQELLPD